MLLLVTVAVVAFTLGFLSCSLFVMAKMSDAASDKMPKT